MNLFDTSQTAPAAGQSPDGPVHVCFSGGRTSGMMLRKLLDAHGGRLPDDWVVVFANTGFEMPETLDFVRDCSQRWGVPISWVEYTTEPPGFRVVDHATASREGEPFEELVRYKKYLPNVMARFCTVELKIRSAKKYLKSLGLDRWSNALGIRFDERDRVKQSPDGLVNWFPLIEMKVSKTDVSEFWSGGGQGFDLELPNLNGKCWLGNCDGCFLKSEKSLAMLHRLHPERAARWEAIEERTGKTFNRKLSRRDLREFIEKQGDWVFDAEDALCQADGGECVM